MALDLIASYRNPGFEAAADGVMAFFDRRIDLQRSGVDQTLQGVRRCDVRSSRSVSACVGAVVVHTPPHARGCPVQIEIHQILSLRIFLSGPSWHQLKAGLSRAEKTT